MASEGGQVAMSLLSLKILPLFRRAYPKLCRREFESLSRMAVVALLIGAGDSLGRVARDARFISTTDSSRLSAAWVMSALALIGIWSLVVVFRNFLGRRLQQNLLLLAAIVLAAIWGAGQGAQVLSPELQYALLRGVQVFLLASFWSLQLRVFGSANPKVHLVTGIFFTVGFFFGSALVRPVAFLLSPDSLLPCWAFLVAFAHYPYFKSCKNSLLPPAESRFGSKLVATLRMDNSVALHSCVTVFLFACVSLSFELLFLHSLNDLSYYASALIIGDLLAVSTLAGLLFSWLLRRIPIRLHLAALSVGISLSIVIYPWYQNASIPLATELMLIAAFFYHVPFTLLRRPDPGNSVVYPVRYGLTITAFALLLSGLTLYFMSYSGRELHLLYPVLLSALLISTWMTRRSGAKALLRNLDGHGRAAHRRSLAVIRHSSDPLIPEVLLSSAMEYDPDQALAGIQLYLEAGGEKSYAAFEPLLSHPSARVRAEAIEIIALELGARKRLLDFLKDPTEEVVARTLICMEQLRMLSWEQAENFMADSRPGIRMSALLIQLHLRKSPDVLQMLRERYRDCSPELQAFTLREAGRLGVSGLDEEMLEAARSRREDLYLSALFLAIRSRSAGSVTVFFEMLYDPEKACFVIKEAERHPERFQNVLPENPTPDMPEFLQLAWPSLSLMVFGESTLLRQARDASCRMRRYAMDALVESEQVFPLESSTLEVMEDMADSFVQDAIAALDDLRRALHPGHDSEPWIHILREVLADRFMDHRYCALLALGLANRRGREMQRMEEMLKPGTNLFESSLRHLRDFPSSFKLSTRIAELYLPASPESGGEPPTLEGILAQMLERNLPWEVWVAQIARSPRLSSKDESMNIFDRIRKLETIPLFKHLRGEDLNTLAQSVWLKNLKNGEDVKELLRERALLTVVSGSLTCSETGEDLNAGESLGAHGLLGALEEKSTWTAKGDTLILVLSQEDFRRVISERPVAGLCVMQALAEDK